MSELIAALSVVAFAVPGHREEARVLQLDTRRDGYLWVETGRYSGRRAGSGHHVLLHRTPEGWVVVDIGVWKA